MFHSVVNYTFQMAVQTVVTVEKVATLFFR